MGNKIAILNGIKKNETNDEATKRDRAMPKGCEKGNAQILSSKMGNSQKVKGHA